MWLCVPESEQEVGWVSTLHKRQIRVSNFSLQCPAPYPFGMSICRLALCREARLFYVRSEKMPRVTTDTAVSLPIEQYTCSDVEEEVVIFLIYFLDSRRAGPA